MVEKLLPLTSEELDGPSRYYKYLALNITTPTNRSRWQEIVFSVFPAVPPPPRRFVSTGDFEDDPEIEEPAEKLPVKKPSKKVAMAKEPPMTTSCTIVKQGEIPVIVV